MKEVIDFLKRNPVQFIATIGRDGMPKVRPFMFMLEQEGKLWFCTNNKKEVYQQLARNAAVEICACSPRNEWLRISGKAVFKNDQVVKANIIESNDLVRSLYQTPENPVFEVFYLSEGRAVLADFSGQPPASLRRDNDRDPPLTLGTPVLRCDRLHR